MDGTYHLVKLNLRGTIFVTNITKFQSFPNSRLGKLFKNGDGLKTNTNEYFFDRSPILFHYILDTYEDGYLHIPKNVCSSVIRRELKYWQLEDEILGKCCLHAFYQGDNDLRIHKEYTDLFANDFRLSQNHVHTTETNTKEAYKPGRREKIWKMISDPSSSRMAKAYFTTIALTVSVSILVFAMSTVDVFRQPRNGDFTMLHNSTNSKLYMYATTRQSPVLSSLDLISNTILAVDLFLTIYGNRNRCKALMHWYRITDILVILFVYVFNIIDQSELIIQLNQTKTKVLSILIAVVYCFRILRIIRLINHTPGVIALYMTILSKANAIFYFVVAFILVCIFSATLLYHAELWTPGSFDNMFTSTWWAVVTISTVGYGDMVPLSIEGKVISVVSIIFGLLIVTIPFVIITNEYGNYYTCNEIIRQHERNVKDRKVKTFNN